MPPKSNRQTPCFSIQELYGCNSSFLGLRGILFSSIRNRKGLNPKRRLEQRAFMHWWQLTFGSTNLQENHGKSKDLEVKKNNPFHSFRVDHFPASHWQGLSMASEPPLLVNCQPSCSCWWHMLTAATGTGRGGVGELGMGITMKDLWRFLGH